MLIIGCDFHSRFQQIAMVDTETGEYSERCLPHDAERQAHQFYAALPEPALVGIESTGYSLWFAELLEEHGHELVVGHAAKIRAGEVRKQKTDARDAARLLELLCAGRFPRVWIPGTTERELRTLLYHRQFLVQMRTRVKNGLQAIAISRGLCYQRSLWTARGRAALDALVLGPAPARRREDLLRLLEQLNGWIGELDRQLRQQAEDSAEARRLMTHPGVGPLTALAAVAVLGPIERFANGKKVASYLGLIPSEYSSGGRQHFGHLTKQGSRLLRFLLVEAAQTACRYDGQLKQDYRRLAFRHGWAKARAAIARKLAIRLYILRRDQIDYAEFVRRGSPAGMPGLRLV
jgi:transposase